ncbi:hypothetical protein Gohar_004484 [Gossypium harknessii]|uniref:RNase H type-1 domain-containing protein n=1 Tax=Gossypium harknessii TaxID=34285 RepID=A0A7J9H4Z3_9ROSI|nr:hypothetical protein [Gossypium harknessii]
MNEIDKNKSQSSIIIRKWRKPPDQFVKINFDAAYDKKYNQATVGIVARDNEGKVCAYISDIHKLLSKLKECRFEYVPRAVNSLTHTVAKETMKDKVTVYLVGGVPEYAEDQEERDRVG